MSAYLQLGFQALFPLIVGSFKSLRVSFKHCVSLSFARSARTESGEDDVELS